MQRTLDAARRQARYRRLAQAAEVAGSPRLRLRPLQPDDAAALWEATRHPAFNTWLTWPQPERPAQVQARVDGLVEQHRHGRSCLLSALDRATGHWVGLYRIGPDLWRADQGWFELGLWLHPAYWGDGHGGGWAPELHAHGTALAFNASDAPGLSARAAQANGKAARTLERMGFVRGEDCVIEVEGGPAHLGGVYRLKRKDWARSLGRGAAA
jgi:RimJ/RimL family protein N-acetyltransferase